MLAWLVVALGVALVIVLLALSALAGEPSG
jgi:hypothetical protein